jgi:predicted RNA-binding protein YlxR (DUF448 family)
VSARPVLRRCVSCRQLLDRRQLWRVVRLAEGGVALDAGMGRSAYVCPEHSCIEEARRRRKLQKALRCQIADSIVAALEDRLRTNRPADAEAR